MAANINADNKARNYLMELYDYLKKVQKALISLDDRVAALEARQKRDN